MRTPAHPRQGFPFRRSALATALACALVPPAMAATYTVDSTADTGLGSLRAAIQAAVSACDTSATIQFAITTGPFVLSPSQGYPAVSNNCPGVQTAIVIDGYSQPGASQNTQTAGFDANLPIVVYGGTYFDSSFQCAFRTADFGYGEGGLWIKGLEIRNFTYGSSPAICAAVKVTGNRILNNATGIHAHPPSQIGGGGFANRNVISGNGNYGILVSSGGAGAVTISDNYIGTGDSGTTPNPNAFGIYLGNATGAIVQGNVLSGNSVDGIYSSGTSSATIQSNFIGVGPNATAAVPNNDYGIKLDCSGLNTISGNTIGANVYGGILVGGSGNNMIQGNTIGTSSFPNGSGISIGYSGCGLLLAGESLAKGLLLGSSNFNTVDSNAINYNSGIGVSVGTGDSNTITNNQVQLNVGHGVQVISGANNKISQNSIYGNTGKNIDLDFYGGPLPNDLLDTDIGANNLQNHPDISLVTHISGNTQISWNINSVPGTTYSLEFFANTASGTPAGKTFIAPPGPPIIAPTDASGNFGQTIQFTGLYDNIAVTATDPAGNTSEFSAAVAVTPTPDVTVAPNPLNFPNTVVGASSGPVPIVVTSAGTAPYTISKIDAASSCYGGPICSSGAFICADSCGSGTYAPGLSCNVSVTFSPVALGPFVTSFYICDNAPGSPRQVTLNGTAVAPPPPTIAPPSFDFGSVAVGGFSTSQTFTVNNPSPTSTTLTAFAITGPFQILSNTCGATIAAGASCAIDTRFAPTAAGSATGVLSATAGSGPISATLTGTATPPPPTTMGPSSFDFGSVTVGTTSAGGVFTITNPALVSVPLSSFSVALPFTIASTTCTSSLAPGASCTATVTYSPSAVGPSSGTISATAGGVPISSGLLGTGVAAPPPLTISPANLNFGTVTVGASSAATGFNVSNAGASAVSLGAIATTGPFAIVTNGCGSSLPASTTCVVNVKFAPVAVGPASGSLDVPASTGNVSAGLQGTGAAAPPLTLSPPGFDFGTISVGSSSATHTFTVANPGSAPVTLSAPTTTGPFSVATTTCSTSLAPSATCDANVKFTPPGNGSFSGSVVVSSSAGSASSVLVGSGLSQAVLEMPTGTIELGTTTLGGPLVIKVITLRNGGNAALTIGSITTAAPFSVTQACPLNLLPGDTCQVTVEHNPAVLGDFTGALVVITNAPGGSRSVPIHVKVQALPEPVIRVAPASIGFGGRVDASPSQRITITNDGGADAVGLSLRFNTPHFTFTTNCGPTLAPQSSCYADAVFRPIGFGPKRDTFSVRSNAAGSPHTVSVSGAGCRPSTGASQSRGGEALNCSP